MADAKGQLPRAARGKDYTVTALFCRLLRRTLWNSGSDARVLCVLLVLTNRAMTRNASFGNCSDADLAIAS